MSRVDLDPGFKRYFRTILQYPLLAADEEARLVALWRDVRNRDAQHQLVKSHLRLVARVALGYRGYGLPLPDLVSEGQLGLIEAVNRFEPGHGSRLAAYALWWIRSAIQEYVLRSWSLVRMGTTSAHKKLFFKLRATKAHLQAIEGGSVASDQVGKIAKALNVRERDVIRMDGWVSGRDQSLNVPLYRDGDGEWQDQLVDEAQNQETVCAEREESRRQQTVLNDALSLLNPRERHILTARRLSDHPLKLHELMIHHGISSERVRQVEIRAFEKVRQAVVARARAAATPA